MEISQLFDIMPGIYIFRISGLEFCINVRDVYLVKRIEEPETRKDEFTNYNEYLTIYNINIPIIDISKYFKTDSEKSADNRMILIIKHQTEDDYLDKTFGIIVDEVTEIISIDRNEDNYRPRFEPAVDNPYLSGSVFLGRREILLPNFSKIAANIFLKDGTAKVIN